MLKALRSNRSFRRLIPIFGVIIIAQAASACALTGKGKNDASNSASGSLDSNASLLQQTNQWAAKWQKNPSDSGIAIGYARSLRAEGSNQKAVQVLQQAALNAPKNQAVIAEFGKALSTAGQYKQAMQNLNRAQTLGSPDWRIYSAQGITLDKMQQYSSARKHYKSALNLKPDQASVLNNLGLSYALEGDLAKAEVYLRRAAAASGTQPKVNRNLALILGLGGKFDQSATASDGVLSAEDTRVNIAYLKNMLSQPGTWQQLSGKTKVAQSAPRKITTPKKKKVTKLDKSHNAAKQKVSARSPLKINPVTAEPSLTSRKEPASFLDKIKNALAVTQKTASIDLPGVRQY